MAFADKKGISVASGFLLQAEAPIDARFTVATKADLDELVTIHAAYKGLTVYCEADGLTYKYNKSGKWVAIDAGTSLPEELSKYLPKAGGTMTGAITFGAPSGGISAVQKNTAADGFITSTTITEDSVTNKASYGINTDGEVVIKASLEGAVSSNGETAVTISSRGMRVDGDISASTVDASTFIGYLQGSAQNAEHAANADHATNADNAAQADNAIRADYANNAGLAENANNASYAENANNASYATSAGTAQSADEAAKLSSPFSINISGGATGSGSTDGSSAANINITSLDGTKIKGVIPLASIPKGAQERCVDVASKDAMLKLTTSDVQNGDVVRVVNTDGTSEMYYVVDETKLGQETAFKVFTAGRASTVPVSGVEGLDEYIKTFLQGGGGTGGADFTFGGNVTINKALNVKGKVTAPEFVGKLTGNASTATALQTARAFSITGGATAAAVNFNGTANVALNITTLSTSALRVPSGDTLILDGNAS